MDTYSWIVAVANIACWPTIIIYQLVVIMVVPLPSVVFIDWSTQLISYPEDLQVTDVLSATTKLHTARPFEITPMVTEEDITRMEHR